MSLDKVLYSTIQLLDKHNPTHGKGNYLRKFKIAPSQSNFVSRMTQMRGTGRAQSQLKERLHEEDEAAAGASQTKTNDDIKCNNCQRKVAK